jgi:hypothetical protein
MSSASSRFGSDQAPSCDTAHVRLDRFSCDVSDRAPSARGFMTQFCIEIIGKLDCCAPHDMPAYLRQLRTSTWCEEWVLRGQPRAADMAAVAYVTRETKG